jgi:hypothetical protein
MKFFFIAPAKAYTIPPRKSFPSKRRHGQISRPFAFGRIKSTIRRARAQYL